MNAFKKLAVMGLALLVLTSCFDDMDYMPEEYWVDIATVENPDSSNAFFFRLDNDILMWTAASNILNYRPADDQRIVANYSILTDKRQTGLYDYDVRLNDVYEVLTKGIFPITPETQDSIGNDSIHIRDIWVGSKYLNVEFVYPGFNKTHYINLVYDSLKTYTDNKLHLEFRHNANDDLAVNNLWGVASFDLSSIEDPALDSIQLVIHVNLPHQSSEQLYQRTYHYGSDDLNPSEIRTKRTIRIEKSVGKLN